METMSVGVPAHEVDEESEKTIRYSQVSAGKRRLELSVQPVPFTTSTANVDALGTGTGTSVPSALLTAYTPIGYLHSQKTLDKGMQEADQASRSSLTPSSNSGSLESPVDMVNAVRLGFSPSKDVQQEEDTSDTSPFSSSPSAEEESPLWGTAVSSACPSYVLL